MEEKRGRPLILPAGRTDWQTPQVVVDRVLAYFGGPPDLDPCGQVGQLMPARRIFTGPPDGEDGLAMPWRGKVWLNPPYGRGIDKWLAKAAAERRYGATTLALVPANASALWFQRWVAQEASVVLFWRGRLRFVGAPSVAGHGHVIALYDLYLGSADDTQFHEVFGPLGWIVP
ncbi:MAG TPA: DNA N-6-adenine-methyltransferase [Methylomirabilota bacterium]|nr:DNA N-6-adenine-methyltransferase [Methylomirabilota bacterium]